MTRFATYRSSMALMLLSLATTVAAQPTIEYISLHPPGTTQSAVYGGIAGQLVGEVGGHAGFWSEAVESWVDLHMEGTELEISVAFASDGAHQVGMAVDRNNWRYAIVWSGTPDSWIDLSPEWSTESEINATCSGRYGGYVNTWSETARRRVKRACMWDADGTLTVLHPEPEVYDSVVTAMTEDQQGGFVAVDGVFHASIWSSTRESCVGLVPEGSLGSAVRAMAGSQQGGGAPVDGYEHAVIWTGTADSRVDLNPEGAESSSIRAMSDRYQGGWARIGARYHAGIWSGTASSWLDLHSFFGPEGYVRSEVQTVWENGDKIYAAGSVVPVGGFGQAMLWIITPGTPDPTTAKGELCEVHENCLAISYSDAQLAFTLQVTTDFTAWTDVTPTDIETQGDTVTAHVDMAGGIKGFFRLIANPPSR